MNLVLSYYMMSSLSSYLISFISHILCLEVLFYLYSVKSSVICIASNSVVGSSISVAMHTTSSVCMKSFKI